MRNRQLTRCALHWIRLFGTTSGMLVVPEELLDRSFPTMTTLV